MNSENMQILEEMLNNSEIYTKSYEEALKHNEQVLSRIKTFKKELEDVKLNLQQNQKELFQNVMVPIGSKALMKGKLVHTNEITINVGDRWFIKKSASSAIQTCDRMIQRCDQNLAEFEKEMNLLSSNLEAPKAYNLFAQGDVQEIMEPYDEEEEKRWKEKHRQNVREYKQKMAANRENETELFEKLDKLEEEEEKENDSDLFNSDLNEFTNEFIDENELPEKSKNMPVKILRKRVSFSESLESTQEFSTVIDDNINIIQFKHSEKKSSAPNNLNKGINSPADIYKQFLENLGSISRKSILKNSVNTNSFEIFEINKYRYENKDVYVNENSSYEGNKTEKVQKSIIKIRRNGNEGETAISLDEDPVDEVFGEIVERKPDLQKLKSYNRPVSSFKKLHNMAKNQTDL